MPGDVEVENSVGGPNAWIDAYGLLAISKLRFYSESMREMRRTNQSVDRAGFPAGARANAGIR